jgi:hypothetical protein
MLNCATMLVAQYQSISLGGWEKGDLFSGYTYSTCYSAAKLGLRQEAHPLGPKGGAELCG